MDTDQGEDHSRSVRAKEHKAPIPRYRSWPVSETGIKLQDFAGYKVGMTHVVIIDDTKNSLTEGLEITVPVTVNRKHRLFVWLL